MYLKILLFIFFTSLNYNLSFVNDDVIQQKEFRVSYVYLNGKELTKGEIDNLREKIINDYESGIPFSELAKKYSMDNNSEKGGDLGWFPEGKMYLEFEEAVKNHKKGEIFIVDIPSRNWYYVVLKTYNDRLMSKN